MKKLAIVTALALVVSYTAAPAFANTTSVVNTAGNATVTTTEQNDVNVTVVNTNVAKVDQSLKAVNDTGHNVSSGNIGMTPCNPCGGISGGSSIVTGDASTSNSMDVQANTNVTAVDVSGHGAAQNNTDVVNTGNMLNVNTSANSNTNVGVVNTNFATVNQHAGVVNNTGWNASTNNVGASNIVTGNAGTMNTMSADVNENATAVSISGNHMNQPGGCDLCGPCYGSNCTSIVNSGKNAYVNTSSNTDTEVRVINTNMMYANQGLFAVNNTGHNFAGNNVYGSDIFTGNAGTGNSMMAEGNSNATVVALDDSMPMGVNDLLAVNSGAYAMFNASANASTNVGTLNTNLLFGNQHATNFSSSGSNFAFNNIGGGLTWTGGAGTASNAAVGGNANATSVGSNASALLALLALMSL